MAGGIVCGSALDELAGAAESLSEAGYRPVVVTDPPFNVGYHYKSYRDRMSEDEYWRMLAEVRGACEGAVFVLYPEMLHRLSIELGEAPERVVSWVYPSNTARQHRDIAFYGVRPDFSRVRQPYRNMSDPRVRKLYERTGGARSYDWIECNQVKNVSREKTAHPCQMPLKVMELVVGVLPDDVAVVDPFCGSGTTLAAAEGRGVPFVGIDVDPAYCEIARSRVDEVREARGRVHRDAGDVPAQGRADGPVQVRAVREVGPLPEGRVPDAARRVPREAGQQPGGDGEEAGGNPAGDGVAPGPGD